VARADDSHGNKLLLAVIALTAAVPMLHMGIHDRIDYDGWQHVFIAREVPWSAFWADVDRNAHPPLFYLLLRAMTWLGSGRLVYRALSIVAAVVATYVVGRIATRVFGRPPCRCSAPSRSASRYPRRSSRARPQLHGERHARARRLPALPRPHRPGARSIEPRTRVLFVVALVGAILSHYSAIFFAGAAVVLRASTPRSIAATGRGSVSACARIGEPTSRRSFPSPW
jgi:hypothetical protein